MTPLDNKVAIVTGAGKTTGIGFATARKLAASVVITDRATNSESEQRLQAGAIELNAMGGNCIAIAADVTDPKQGQNCVARTAAELGGGRYLVQ
jgi:NAD(P)-dependent dehydrogenase (short-subunit alcohol dehydrogenase family)